MCAPHLVITEHSWWGVQADAGVLEWRPHPASHLCCHWIQDWGTTPVRQVYMCIPIQCASTIDNELQYKSTTSLFVGLLSLFCMKQWVMVYICLLREWFLQYEAACQKAQDLLVLLICCHQPPWLRHSERVVRRTQNGEIQAQLWGAGHHNHQRGVGPWRTSA